MIFGSLVGTSASRMAPNGSMFLKREVPPATHESIVP